MSKTVNTTVRGPQVVELIRKRVAFKAGGTGTGQASFRGGSAYDNYGTTGALNSTEKDAYYADANSIDYVVYSYATPIAWHTPKGWHVVNQKFSVTTSRHQSSVRQAVR
jgi:hypothetical protein